MLNWNKEYAISFNALAAHETLFLVINATNFVPLVTLSTQDKWKLFERLNYVLK